MPGDNACMQRFASSSVPHLLTATSHATLNASQHLCGTALLLAKLPKHTADCRDAWPIPLCILHACSSKSRAATSMHDARKLSIHGVVGVHRQQHSARTDQWRDQWPLLHHITRRPLRCTALRDVIYIDDVRNLDQLCMSTWCGGHAP
jgi:hypothetical protein